MQSYDDPTMSKDLASQKAMRDIQFIANLIRQREQNFLAAARLSKHELKAFLDETEDLRRKVRDICDKNGLDSSRYI